MWGQRASGDRSKLITPGSDEGEARTSEGARGGDLVYPFSAFGARLGTVRGVGSGEGGGLLVDCTDNALSAVRFHGKRSRTSRGCPAKRYRAPRPAARPPHTARHSSASWGYMHRRTKPAWDAVSVLTFASRASPERRRRCVCASGGGSPRRPLAGAAGPGGVRLQHTPRQRSRWCTARGAHWGSF